MQIRVYKIKKDNLTHFSQFISADAKNISRKSQAQFRKKLGTLRLKQNNFLVKESVIAKVNNRS